MDRDSAPSARVQLDLTTNAGAQPAFPTALDPALPSVDRISHNVRAALGDMATAEIDLCVAPSGSVTKVEIARSSNLEAFDEAVLRDARAWRFASLPGPDTLQSCRRATIAYRAH